jgi:hypothetical protein
VAWRPAILVFRISPQYRNIARLLFRPVSFCRQPTAPPSARGSPHETCFLKHAAVDMSLKSRHKVLTMHGEECCKTEDTNVPSLHKSSVTCRYLLPEN